jgi:hypothetical protein
VSLFTFNYASSISIFTTQDKLAELYKNKSNQEQSVALKITQEVASKFPVYLPQRKFSNHKAHQIGFLSQPMRVI